MDKDLKKLIAELERQGFEVRINKNGHPVAYKDNRRIATLSGTPSDRRSWQNGLAPLRRAGFIWPH